MLYRIFDIRKGLMNSDVFIEAKSPIEAVRKTYPNTIVERDYTNTGNIIVNGSYVYTVKKQGN